MKQPEFKTVRALSLVGCAEPIKLSEGDVEGVGRAWQRLFAEPCLNEASRLEPSVFWGATYGFDQDQQTFFAGQEGTGRSDGQEANDRLARLETTERLYAVFEHRGHPHQLGRTHGQAYDWIVASDGYTFDAPFTLERYDERCNPEDPEGYVIDLYYPVRPLS
ncbi:GyrI-like domain-containing protein [Pseudovibrio exalbescens]|uniref:AraC effector-binding domain-containing protein n=1 Tax=Pseudovibrio exalbescens TaxID=197461 RepID=A0A1U7JLS8_9HYPH|nr:GyrI-like domain-containing protein [Pseudovibrio exalbescens]OKL45679.1 hypothetical protein A3843_01725 [Pseudovibrio exalbescens]